MVCAFWFKRFLLSHTRFVVGRLLPVSFTWTQWCLRGLANRLFVQAKRKHQSFALLTFCDWNSQMICGLPSQRASNADIVFLSWCHRVLTTNGVKGAITLPAWPPMDAIQRHAPLECAQRYQLDITTYNHFPQCWLLVKVIHRSPVGIPSRKANER